MIIAIDGPAGTGKGKISKLIAKRLGFLYIDTGAMYRAVAVKLLRNKIGIEDKLEIKKILEKTSIELKTDDTETEYIQKVYLDGEDVTSIIRMPEVNECVSQYSSEKIIRERLVELQRKMAVGKNVIMEGRDITTVVFPNADVKIYLTASPEERAKRRWLELKAKGIETSYEETLENINKRDYNDMHKEMGALKIADDATVVDTTFLSIEEVYEKVKDIIQKR